MRKAILVLLLSMFASTAFALGGGFNTFGSNAWGESSRPSEKGDGTFAQGEALKNGSFLEGEVVFTRAVALEGQHGQTVGQVTGGALGALAGSKIGKGKGKYAGMIVGGLLGASVGGSVGRGIGEDQATELFVKLEDGRKISIVQIMEKDVRRGDRVFVTKSSGGNFRVVSLASMY